MFILQQLRSEDRRMRWFASVVALGMVVLVAGIWWVQIVSTKDYKTQLKTQSVRTVRLPAIRGKVLDRHGSPLAENRPSFNINLYLDEIRPLFLPEYEGLKRAYAAANPGAKIDLALREKLQRDARYLVASNITAQVGAALNSQLILDREKFERHYHNFRYVPLPVLKDLSPAQVALFSEGAEPLPGVDLEIQAVREYPRGAAAAHLVGHIRMTESPDEEDDYNFKYVLPVPVGKMGVEAAFEEELKGVRGRKLILVNNIAYRESEEIWPEPSPGHNIIMALDIEVQEAALAALQGAGAETRGAIVVMDVWNGDILAAASAPSFDPNLFVTGISHEQWQEMIDPNLKPMFNRATFGIYPPGSIFKMVVGLAALEANVLDPEEKIYNRGFFQDQELLGSRRYIKDEAPAGFYDLERALKKSSNTYFVYAGLRTGLDGVLDMGRRFFLGRNLDSSRGGDRGAYVPNSAGYFPPNTHTKNDGRPWFPGDTANLCLGQGDIAVTPLQMAVMTAAIANGGKVVQPRMVRKIEAQNRVFDRTLAEFPARLLNDTRVKPQHMKAIQDAMLADVEDWDGTGRAARVPGLGICGKTGTAQVTAGRRVVDHITWFVSFAPYESPKYAVVVMVESGHYGGTTCAPMAKKVYLALKDLGYFSREKEALTERGRSSGALEAGLNTGNMSVEL